MRKLSIKLENCFGIEKLQHEFDFSRSNVFSIYAKNGLMKTSFAKTFKLLQEGKEDDICDMIFDKGGTTEVKIDGTLIDKDQVFVIKSFESSYESDISALLIKGDIQEQLKEVFKVRNKLLKELEKLSGVKIKKTLQGRTTYELEPYIIKDLGLSENSLLLCLDSLKNPSPEITFEGVAYSEIFDPSILKKIESKEFQDGITSFISSSDEIYESFVYLEKGKLTLPKFKDLRKSLQKDSFFIKNNGILLSGNQEIKDIDSLDSKVQEIEDRIKQTPSFQEIEKLLSDAKGIALKDIIETHPEIIEYLSKDKLDMLRKILWLTYLKKNESLLNELISKYKLLSDAIDAVSVDDTEWKHALDIFDQRFTVPFSMSVDNLKGAVIGESVPQVKFNFTRGSEHKTVNRSELDELDTLSQGEKRALYLLNIIFDIEQLKKRSKEVIIIVDDIADSFDYKNKYAIIEYLYEMAKESNFYLLILSHNYDFYRTVSSRLNIDRTNKLFANFGNHEINLYQEKYQNQPFKYWANQASLKYVLALIPFVRNLIEYGKDRNICGQGEDFLYMTSLLHEKHDTYSITFADIEPIYKEYIDANDFKPEINKSVKVIDAIFTECDKISVSDAELENKIILAIGIRHKAEIFMKSQISAYSNSLSWKDKDKHQVTGTSSDFLSFVNSATNQTHTLFDGYKQFGTDDKKMILNEVSIMTPENIHLNSFMYEPLLDMDITELLSLYNRVKAL
ncbi:hypothetical protein [Ruminococcus albus]|uniref:Uncharacterized protein n=1 Tax=Ruminococcus albus TaxID=1264 RepID=A0A1H7PB12_RUMAL|nr:hypothetical protein [Ruminococcus albus]SEL32455.1 hypothetical protein SAMN05216469_12012 [Ruminococcus albus]